MKNQAIRLALVSGACALLSVGCLSALKPGQAATSYPVTSGDSSTNDSAVVGYLKVAQAINKTANPTQSEPIVDLALGAAIALGSSVAGFFQHKTASKAAQQVVLAPVSATVPLSTTKV